MMPADRVSEALSPGNTYVAFLMRPPVSFLCLLVMYAGLQGLPPSQTTASVSGVSKLPPPGLLEKIRSTTFFMWSLLLSVPLFMTMITMAPFVMAFDKHK